MGKVNGKSKYSSLYQTEEPGDFFEKAKIEQKKATAYSKMLPAGTGNDTDKTALPRMSGEHFCKFVIGFLYRIISQLGLAVFVEDAIVVASCPVQTHLPAGAYIAELPDIEVITGFLRFWKGKSLRIVEFC